MLDLTRHMRHERVLGLASALLPQRRLLRDSVDLAEVSAQMIVVRLRREVFVLRTPLPYSTAPTPARVVVGSWASILIGDLVKDE
jgi:hypothetical protein